MNGIQARLIAVVTLVALSGTADAHALEGLEADEWTIQTWQVDDGLPDSSATAMAQTPDRYLWFGTFDGLVRFDGATFTVLDPDNTPQLPGRKIVNLHTDQRGWLWISTTQGLVVRAGARWLDFTRDPALEGAIIRTFAERGDGDLLLTTFDGKVVEFTESGLNPLPEPPGNPGRGYWGGVDDAGRWWVVQNRFVGRWDGQRWMPSWSASELEGVEPENVGCAPARDGGLWVLVGTNLRRFSQGSEVQRRQLSKPISGVWSLFEDSHGDIWIPSYSLGLFQLSPSGRLRCRKEINGLACDSFRFAFEDNEQNLWVGTNSRGLTRLTARRFHDFGTRTALPAPVTSVAPAPGGGLWVATYGAGLFRLDDNELAAAPVNGFRGFGDSLQSVLTDRQGSTWVGMFYMGLYVFDSTGGRYVPEGRLVGGTVIALFEDSRERIWISGNQQVAVVEGEVTRLYGPDEGLPAAEVVCFAEDRDGIIWLSCLAGVYRLAGDRFVEVRSAGGSPIRNIACLKSDDDGTMWMGSTKAGLLRWREGVLAGIGPESGLAAGRVFGILDDEAGHLWLSSDRGVMRVARAEVDAVADKRLTKLTCQRFDSTDGLPTMECSGLRQPVCARDADGRLWFATTKGVGMADPARFPLNTTPPLVHIEKIVYRVSQDRTGDGSEVQRSVQAPFPDVLDLPPGNSGTEIHYAAPSFAAPDRVRFQIRLEPIDQAWRDVGNRRVAYFSDLYAGRYLFRVRAANSDGVWNEVGAGVRFDVLPLFWETGWFRALVTTGICVVICGLVYRLLRRQRRQRLIQAEFTRQLIARQEAERKRLAAELHDGLGHDLLLIQTRMAVLAKGNHLAPEISGQLEELSTEVTRLITDLRSVSRALRPGALEQVGLTHAIRWMVEELTGTSGMEFAVDLDDIDGLLTPEMEINIYRIVQEALNNVVKHAGAGHVTISAKRSAAEMGILVEDNGSGFDARLVPGDGQPSFGLTGMKERAHFLNGRIDFQSAPGMGTRVTVKVPLPRPGQTA